MRECGKILTLKNQHGFSTASELYHSFHSPLGMSIRELPHLIDKGKSRKRIRYGDIPGLPVLSCFENRAHLYRSGMHVTLQAGIQGRAETGACSVVLSGGYEDDVDLGYEFTYTGHGGQLPRHKGDRSQKKDQEWKRGNLALQVSCQFKKPVRVIRGHSLKTKWAPVEGYRYDGLYNVVEFARTLGKSGFYVCLFRFVRQPNQSPLPKPSDSYQVGEGPQITQNTTPSPRIPPRYSPPADIRALFPPAIVLPSRRPKKKTLPMARGLPIPMATSNKGTSSGPTPSSSSRASTLPQRQDLKKLPKINKLRRNSEGSAASLTSQLKGKQKATEPVEVNRPGQSKKKYPYTAVNKTGRTSNSAARIHAWDSFYTNDSPKEMSPTLSAGKGNATGGGSDTDDGEFSEGEDDEDMEKEDTTLAGGSEEQQGESDSSEEMEWGEIRPISPKRRTVPVYEISSEDEDDDMEEEIPLNQQLFGYSEDEDDNMEEDGPQATPLEDQIVGESQDDEDSDFE